VAGDPVLARDWLRFAVVLSLGAAVLAAVAVALAGYGYRWGWWDLRTGFAMLPYGAYAGGGVAVVAMLLGIACLALKRWRLAPMAMVAMLLAGGALALPLSLQMRARSAPPIHDITTDLSNPPAFVALKQLRDGTPNGSTYGGSIVADQQRAHYGDIAAVSLALPPAQAMAKAEQVARAMGWHVVASDGGQLEATATTPWFGFKDDVVIRVRADGAGSRIDIRSVSRIGSSDLGTNARRVREAIERLKR
jgi:uncharacterized protein (DUF1499 family)